MVVNVKEARTASIGGGIGYGSSDGLLLNANLADKNIFGTGINARVDIERSDSVLSGTISVRILEFLIFYRFGVEVI